jgi:HemY protein
MQESERRDAWMAQVTDPEREQARLVSMAELLVDARDAEGALETIAQLQEKGGRQIHVQRIALRAHQHLKNWSEVLRLARSLEKRNALHPVLALRLKQMAVEAMLEERRHDAEALFHFWRSLTADERHAVRIAEQGRAISRRWQAERGTPHRRGSTQGQLGQPAGAALRRLRGAGKALPQIQQAEKWLVDHPNDADLYYTLGVLCLGEQLWGKAQSNFERTLKYADRDAQRRICMRAHLALARLFEETDRAEDAQRHYRESAMLAACSGLAQASQTSLRIFSPSPRHTSSAPFPSAPRRAERSGADSLPQLHPAARSTSSGAVHGAWMYLSGSAASIGRYFRMNCPCGSNFSTA